ncbi:hypothetical protein FO519_004861 [Halicephalobus sp. NKZ332]|nr:hypothetical protein FO519_004861 [Halicephalobus sp. NKZ332]
MSGKESELVSLLLSKAEGKIKSRLKDLEGNHNLELLLEALLRICKKAMLGAELHPCVVPFIKKHFGSLSTMKATSLVQEFTKYSSKEYSIRTSVPLLKLLIETAQLGNASNLRRSVKTNVVSLHNRLRQDGFNREADLLLACINNVFLLELNLLDNVNLEEIETVWRSLQKPKEKQDIYLFASFLIYTALDNQDEASIFEDQFCKSFEPDQSFVDYCLPFFHIVLPNFKTANAVLFLKRILKFYVEEKKLEEFYEAVFKVPELRNNQFRRFGNFLISSTLTVLWEKVSREKKRKSGDSGEILSEIKALSKVFNEVTPEFQFTADSFKKFFSQCCKVFSKFVYNKEMKATSFVDCLLAIRNLIPSFDVDEKCLLVTAMPFVLTCTGEESKLTQILKVYLNLLNDIPKEFVAEISMDHATVSEFLDVVIRKSSRESNELRYRCAKVVSVFLHSDWTFIKGFIKGKKAECFESLNSTFNKAIRAQKRFPKSEISTVFQTCVYIYEKETENIKSKNFKPEKGLRLLVTSLSDLLKSIVSGSSDLSTQGPAIGGVIVDLVNVFIQLVRFCKIAEVEVENVEIISPILKHLFDEENGLSLIQEAERTFVLDLLLENMVKFRIHVNLDDFFVDVGRLFNLAKSPQCEDRILKRVVKQILLKQDNISWKQNLVKKFPEVPADEEKNVIFRFLRIVLESGKGDVLKGLERFIFNLLIDFDAASVEFMEFGAVYLVSIEEKKDVGDFVSVVLLSCVNTLASQSLTKQHEVIVAEMKKSTAAVTVIESLTKMQSKVLVNQIHIVGQMMSKLIFNLTIFRQFVQESRENPKRRQEVKLIFDNFLKQLSIVCKGVSSESRCVKQLPMIISNCLTGEREPNLPTYNLLAGCDNGCLSFLATNLPSEQKRRFNITFPDFIEKNKFTG